MILGEFDVEYIGLLHGHPDRARPFLPAIKRKIGWRMRDKFLVLARFDKGQKIIRHAAAAFAAVFLELFVEQPDVLGPRHLSDWAFPDRASAVKNEPGLFVDADNVT